MWSRFVVVLVCLGCAGFAAPQPGRQSLQPRVDTGGPEPSPTPIPTPEPEPISGRERLAWEFEARSAEEIEALGFTAFVDDIATDLQGVTCHPIAGVLELSCTSPLPPMSDGTHRIQVAAYVDGHVHGLLSAPIFVRLEAPSGPLSSAARLDSTFTTTDGVRLGSAVVAAGFVDPTDLAIVPDGRVLIAERSGRIRVFGDGQLMPAPAASLSDVTTGDGRGLLALTVDAAFEKTRAVYAVYTAASGARLARFALRGDTLESRAVLLDGLPLASSRPTASLRMGPDLRLYLGLDDGGDPGRAEDLGSYSGKVLRLTRDGTTPDDQAGSTPVFIGGIHRPAGTAWQRGSTTTWIVTRDAGDIEQLYAVTSDEPRRRGRIVARRTLPAGVGAADVLLYDSPAIAEFQGDLLVAAEGAILRLRSPESGEAEPEWLLRGLIGSVKAVGVAPDGAIYALAGDLLLRITHAGGS
jgi:glucose/arabinose dehydrogenase